MACWLWAGVGDGSSPKATFKPPWSSLLKREAETCLYFHFKATQTLLLLLAPLFTESICKVPREIPQVFRLLFNAGGGEEKSYPLKVHLLQASLQPPEFMQQVNYIKKITVHRHCVGFTLPYRPSRTIGRNFKGNPTTSSSGCC